ncbi:MAG: hypothetical protein GIKADHBN_00431 [Phycisphaerales bacterium]|nr:hypothetical protein [Phycisphaerales bacterium]
MNSHDNQSVEERWARAGVLLSCEPSRKSPDLERLICDTAQSLPGNARLLPLVATWLARHGKLVARHRLRRLISLAPPAHKAVLGLLLESAISHGAPRTLRLALSACTPASGEGPLFSISRSNSVLASVARDTASPVSKRWGVWAPEVELKDDAVRPISWILENNPGFRHRLIRKGDLRCSIVEALRLDADRHAQSESQLARLVGATRVSVRRALEALEAEGVVRVNKDEARDHPVVLRRAA